MATTQSPATQQPMVTNVTVEGAIGNANTQDIEIIPENPFEEIVLKVEDISPLDVFYSPKHRAIVRKKRKKRKINKSPFSSPQTKITNVV